MRQLFFLLLAGLACLAGCASGDATFVPNVRSCDRNGDQEQRIACDR
jgi:hypothetical protein